MAKMKKTLVGAAAVAVLVGSLAGAGILSPISDFVTGGLATFKTWTGDVQDGIVNNKASIDKIVTELEGKSDQTRAQIIQLVIDNAPVVVVDDTAIVNAVDAFIDANRGSSEAGGSNTISSLAGLNQALTHAYSAGNLAQGTANDARDSVNELANKLNTTFGSLSFTPPQVIADFP